MSKTTPSRSPSPSLSRISVTEQNASNLTPILAGASNVLETIQSRDINQPVSRSSSLDLSDLSSLFEPQQPAQNIQATSQELSEAPAISLTDTTIPPLIPDPIAWIPQSQGRDALNQPVAESELSLFFQESKGIEHERPASQPSSLSCPLIKSDPKLTNLLNQQTITTRNISKSRTEITKCNKQIQQLENKINELNQQIKTYKKQCHDQWKKGPWYKRWFSNSYKNDYKAAMFTQLSAINLHNNNLVQQKEKLQQALANLKPVEKQMRNLLKTQHQLKTKITKRRERIQKEKEAAKKRAAREIIGKPRFCCLEIFKKPKPIPNLGPVLKVEVYQLYHFLIRQRAEKLALSYSSQIRFAENKANLQKLYAEYLQHKRKSYQVQTEPTTNSALQCSTLLAMDKKAEELIERLERLLGETNALYDMSIETHQEPSQPEPLPTLIEMSSIPKAPSEADIPSDEAPKQRVNQAIPEFDVLLDIDEACTLTQTLLENPQIKNIKREITRSKAVIKEQENRRALLEEQIANTKEKALRAKLIEDLTAQNLSISAVYEEATVLVSQVQALFANEMQQLIKNEAEKLSLIVAEKASTVFKREKNKIMRGEITPDQLTLLASWLNVVLDDSASDAIKTTCGFHQGITLMAEHAKQETLVQEKNTMLSSIAASSPSKAEQILIEKVLETIDRIINEAEQEKQNLIPLVIEIYQLIKDRQH